MELDDLKILLKEQPATMHVVKSADDIAVLLSSKTKSIIGKLRRNLKIEIIACVVFTIPCVAVAIFSAYTSLRIYFGIFAVIFLLFLPLLIMLLKKTNEFRSTALPVKSNLQSLVNLMQEFVKRYFQFTMALIPISLLMSFLLGYNDATSHQPDMSDTFLLTFNWSVLKITFVVVYILAFVLAAYYFTRWYIKKLYGNYLEQLQLLIKELEE
ncbi:MAG: hypothetical protein ABI921_10300 [Panacibacter sp.]